MPSCNENIDENASTRASPSLSQGGRDAGSTAFLDVAGLDPDAAAPPGADDEIEVTEVTENGGFVTETTLAVVKDGEIVREEIK